MATPSFSIPQQMWPTSPAFDVVNCAQANVEISGDGGVFTPVNNDGFSLFFRQFCLRMFFTFGLAAFGKHVIHVVSLIAQKKMIGIYANRIVASVQNMLVARNGAAKQMPSHTMRSLHDNSKWPHGATAVTTARAKDVAGPVPASIQLLIGSGKEYLGYIHGGIISRFVSAVQLNQGCAK